jgi:mRNA-degrading endonuclease HigB of HigAB toxin-antitoxin module
MKAASLLVIITTLFLSITSSNAQDLFGERIRKLTGSKKSIFLDSGIFHNGASGAPTTLKSIRSSFDNKLGYERIVFDFSGNAIPRVYGHIAGNEKKVLIDFFDTEIADTLGGLGNSKFVDGVNFFPLSKESLSVEVNFKKKMSVDIFYLENPGRLVIDIK